MRKAGMSNIQKQIDILIEVQDVEGEILQADRQIHALDKEAAALDHAAQEREAQLKAERVALEDLQRRYRELESESKINADLIIKSNEKLRAVKTNKEYQMTLKEIEDVRKKNSAIEDRMLEKLETIEETEASIKHKEIALSEFLQSCYEKKDSLIAQVKRERQTVHSLNEKKRQISAKADPKMIIVLDDVKKKVRGMAVVPAQQAICMGCHMNIPPQLFNELQRFDAVRFCPHCHRIIYWKEPVDE
jgi:predicted  nucleic acid-binding Zn-ribbon protein